MGRFSALMLALILGSAGAVVLASCGGGSDAKLLPGTTASQIESNLDQVKALVESGDCVGAEDAVAEVSAEVEEVNVAAKLKGALQEGTAKLSEVVGRCEEEAGEEETEPSAAADVEAEELESEQLEAEEKAEKAQEKAEKQEQKEEKEKPAPEVEESEGTLPPQAEGKAKGHEEETPPPAAEPPSEESESGGVSPSEGVE
jgi:flagellar biosynthesis GTPase FlhF